MFLVATSDGVLNYDRQPLARMGVAALARARRTERRSEATQAAAAASDLSFFLNRKTPEHFAAQAVRQALIQLDAIPAPAGEMTVVLGPGWPGILLHEAVGHGLEADFNRKGVSAFSDRIGQQVASPLCTVVDDGAIANRRGSLERRRRRQSDAAERADRERCASRISAGQAIEPHYSLASRPAPAVAKAISTSRCRA